MNRAAYFCSAALVVVASTAHAEPAPEVNRYYIRAMTETFDGVRVRSVSQDLGFGRMRQGNRSWVVLDFGDGRAVQRSGNALSVGSFTSPGETDAVFAYDYASHELRGSPEVTWFHNRLVRPLLDRSPALGADARWSLALAAADVGVGEVTGGQLNLDLERRYFTAAGVELVLVTYSFPAFHYVNAAGETVVHWGRGAMLADPGFGTIYWAASRQQAVARAGAGQPRPYRFAKTFIGAGLDGKPLIDLSALSPLAPLLAAMARDDESAVAIGDAEAAEPDQSPLTLSAAIDMAALAVGENSANQALETAGSFAFGNVGRTSGAVEGAAAALSVSSASAGSDRQLGARAFTSDKAPAFAQDDANPSAHERAAEVRAPSPAYDDAGGGAGGGGSGGGKSSGGGGPSAKPRTPIDVNVAGNAPPGALSGLIETAGEYYGGDKGKGAGANADIGVGLYGTPDKLIATLNAMADAAPGRAEAIAFVNRWTEYGTVINARAEVLGREIAALRSEYNTLYDSANKMRVEFGAAAQALSNSAKDSKAMRDFYSQIGRSIGTLGAHEAETKAMAVLSRLEAAQDKMRSLISSAQALEAASPMVAKFRQYMQNQKYFEAAAEFKTATDAMGLQRVFTVAGGIGNVASVLSASSTLGGYEPEAAGDRTFYTTYANKKVMISTLGLNILGFAANASTGNPVATFADVAAWGSGYLSDLYLATQDVIHASETTQQATLDYALLQMKRRNQLEARYLASLEETTRTVSRINQGLAELRDDLSKLGTNGIDDPNWKDPRYDPVTGLPKPNYWAHLKKNNPEFLRRIGIDPDAPVGGWPGGRKPDVTPPKPPEIVMPQQPDDKPAYPTAKPKPKTALTGARAGLAAGQVSAEDEVPAPTEWTPPAPTKPAAIPKPAAYIPPKWTPEWLKVSALNPTPLNFEPVKPFKAPEYKNPEYKNPDFKAPEFVPPKFTAPKPSEIKWQASKDYPGTGDNLAFGFGDLAGKVATDLAPWRAWLAKQNVRHLTDLAIAGGYPTLAAALTDAANLRRQANDQGFRSYAYGPPGFSGAISIAFARQQLDMAVAQVLLGDALNAGRFGDAPVPRDDADQRLRDLAVNDTRGLERLLAQPFNVLLTWGAGAYDLDLHMTGPTDPGGRFHIYYVNRGSQTASPFAELIRDCICNSGSEVILTSQIAQGGTYRISAFNFGDQAPSSLNLSNASGAKIQIVRGGVAQAQGNGTTIVGGRTIFTTTPPSGQPGNTWVAVEIDPNSGRIASPNRIVQSAGSGGVQ